MKTLQFIILILSICSISGCSLEKKINKIAKAIEGIDPLGVKAQIDRNEELKKKLETATLKLSGALTGSGGMEIADGQKIQLKISEVVGEFIIKAWIDERTQPKQIFLEEVSNSDLLDN